MKKVGKEKKQGCVNVLVVSAGASYTTKGGVTVNI